MNPELPPCSERDSIIAAAASSMGKSPAERMQMFFDIMAAEEAKWANLSPEERRRRREIADQLDPRPNPWWKNLRPEAIPDESRDTSTGDR